jgi:aminoglycoside phosphotransferase family enzyme/predicted kinase
MIESDQSQDEVFSFLAAPSTHGGASAHRIDTHAASVFLAGGKAYKVKRNVRFPFLDYSSLERRHAACQSELEVNRRFAPKLYRRVVAITRQDDGRLALDGHGTVVEWAVEMTRFDENKTFDHLADRGDLDADLCRKLARTIATMQESAGTADGGVWIAALDDYIEQNIGAFRAHAALFDPGAVEDLSGRARETLKRLHPLLTRRAAMNLVRRGHGDLHLGNLALVEGEPMAFDAIEFDEVIASGDVLYELAFVLMDLAERDRADLANVVLNEYFSTVRRDADLDGVAALPFFMSLRAAIRAMVTVARLERASQVEKAAVEESARRYFALARELLQPTHPVIACTAGLSGTGKSVLARSLAPMIAPLPGALILRSDVERKAMFGIAETQNLPADAYTSETSTNLYSRLCEKAARVARAGHAVIVDAVFARKSERREIESAARQADAEFVGLFMTAPLDVRLARVSSRRGDASDADARVAREQESYDLGPMNWATIDASGSPEQTLAKASKILALYLKEPEPPPPATHRI